MMSSLRKTKVVATIGPACDAPDVLRRLIEAGMNVARLNLSHGSHDDHARRIERIRGAAAELATHVAIMADTRGVEIRTGPVEGDGVELRVGAPFTLHADRRSGDETGVSVSYPGLPDEVMAGSRILLDDGALELRVEEVKGREIRCVVVRGGPLKSAKGVNLPEETLQLSTLGPEHRDDLLFAAAQGVEYVAASFVRHADDVRAVKALLSGTGAPMPVIAKIENRGGVENLEEILSAADGAMVARGDLGVEIPLEEVPIIQKRIIRATVGRGKPVITATQMLSSMEERPQPTRAEVSDVANAILDGTSAVMLSGETAVGRYPVEAVRTMSTLALRAEGSLSDYGHLQHAQPEPSNVVTEAVSQAAITMARHLEACAIVALTESGFTARSISKHRPDCPILAVTVSERVARMLALNWGVAAVVFDGDPTDDEEFVAFATEHLRARGWAQSGDVAVSTAGSSRKKGSTDRIRVVYV